MSEKRCTKCDIVKPVEDFHRVRKNEETRHTWCRVCCNAYKRDHSRENRIQKLPRYMLYACRDRARQRGLECTITIEDIESVMVEVCPVLNIPLTVNEVGSSKDNSYSLDRVDNNKGYVPGNIQIISGKANNMKSNATLEELEALVAYMRRHV